MNPIRYLGIRRIRDLCQEHGVAEPLIEVVRFVGDYYIQASGRTSRHQVPYKSPASYPTSRKPPSITGRGAIQVGNP